MEKLFDPYVWQARVLPAFLTLLPIALAFSAWMGKLEDVTKPLTGLVVGAGGVVLLAHLARDAGKRVARHLFAGGVLPTTRMLRHSDPTIDRETKNRYRKSLESIVPGIVMPTPEEEATNPLEADSVYSSAVAFLREQTRDAKKFRLVFAENVSYGFRRNLVGLRPFGLSFSTMGLFACAAVLTSEWNSKASLQPLPSLCLGACLLMLLAWALWLKDDWVRRGAEAYAQRLLATLDSLTPPKPKPSGTSKKPKAP